MKLIGIILEIKKNLKNIFSDFISVYFEKGIDPFKKPLIYGFGMILLSYVIYFPSSSKYEDLKGELNQLEIVTRYYDNYIQIKESIKRYYSFVPSFKDKEEFLGYVLNTLASKHKISFSKIESQKEVKTNFGVFVVYNSVSFSTDYYTLGNFIRDIENYKPFVYVSEINITKSDNQTVIGNLDVDLTIATIFVNRVDGI